MGSKRFFKPSQLSGKIINIVIVTNQHVSHVHGEPTQREITNGVADAGGNTGIRLDRRR
jgi:hypothetical protein